MVIAVEYTLIRHLTRDQRRRLVRQENTLHPGLLNIIYFMISLSCSMLANSVIANLGKRTVSRLRPNFLAVCKPDLDKLCPPNTFRYVDDYVCHGDEREDEYFSFPSGHAAQAVNFAVFTIYYLQKRCKLQEPIRPFLQLLIFLLAFFIALSRVRDRMHRLADVGGGALIGLLTGTFFVTYVLHHFRPSRYAIEEVSHEKIPGHNSIQKRSLSGSILPSTTILEKPNGWTHDTERGYVSGCSGYGSVVMSSSSSENGERSYNGSPIKRDEA